MKILVSGCTESRFREWSGELSGLFSWLPAAAFFAEASSRQRVWLYQPPWALQPGENAEAMLRGWRETQREVLRQRATQPLQLVNLARTSPAELQALLKGEMPARAAEGLSFAPGTLLQAHILLAASPPCWEVFEALEAAALLAPGQQALYRHDLPVLTLPVLQTLLDQQAGSLALQQEVESLRSVLKAEQAGQADRFEELASLTRMLESQGQQLHQEREAQARLQIDLAERELELANLREQIANAQQAEVQINSEQQRLQEALAAAQAEQTARFEELAGLTRMLEAQQHAEASKLAAQQETHARAIEALQKQHTAALAAVQTDLRSARSSLADRFAELGKLTRMLDQRETALARLEQAHQSARAELERYRNAGLRGLIRRLKAGSQKGKQARKLAEQLALLRSSPFFDADWYLATYPDVQAAGLDPATHYLKFGAKEGRNPSPQFDTADYLNRYPDVAAAGHNPLIHYLRFGKAESRSISPVSE